MLPKWVWGTNCTYHQKSSLENSFQTYAWGNESVSLPVCHSTRCYSGCFSSWHCFSNALAPGLLWVSLCKSQAVLWGAPLPSPACCWWSLACSSPLTSPISSSFSSVVWVLAAGTIPVVLPPLPRQERTLNGRIQCTQKIGVRCSESSAFCLGNLWELLVHYVSFLSSLQVVYSPLWKYLSQ